MPPLKAPGLYGYAAYFFQQNWATVGVEVSSVVLGILNSSSMTKELNSFHLHCFHSINIKNTSCVAKIKPISLCNVLYKIVSKVIVNRLKVMLLHIISPY